MHLWLIYDENDIEKNKQFIQMFRDGAAQRGCTLELYIKQRFSVQATGIAYDGVSCILPDAARADCDGNACVLPDAAINRSRDALLSKRLAACGVPVFNDPAIAEIGNDKGALYTALKGKGIPLMETFLCTRATGDGLLPYPYVLKSRGGHGGSEVFRIANAADYAAACEKIGHDALIVQRPASERGRDLRVYVVGNQIAAGMLRTSNTDFRSNYSLGGSASVHTLTEAERAIVDRVLALYPIGMAGIDLIYDNGAPVLNEIEDVVGARMLYAHTDVDLVGRFLDHVVASVESSAFCGLRNPRL